MLVLSRKRNEKVLIGDNIAVVVVEIRGDKVRLGFAAPPEINIVRPDASDKTPKNREADL